MIMPSDDRRIAEPLELMDQDLAASTLEPLVTCIFDQLAAEMGLQQLRRWLPIDVAVTITLRSGERTLATAVMGTRVETLEHVS